MLVVPSTDRKGRVRRWLWTVFLAVALVAAYDSIWGL